MPDHHCVGTEHLLLGLLLEGDDVWVGIVERLGASREAVRTAVVPRLGQAG